MRERDDNVPADPEPGNRPWVVGHVETPAGRVPRVASRWTWRDRLGAMAVRWNVGRRNYSVAPGLYAVGSPTAEAPLEVRRQSGFKVVYGQVRSKSRALALDLFCGCRRVGAEKTR